MFCSFFASHPSCGRTIIFHHHCACGAGCRASADFGLLFLASTYACDTCRTLLSPGPVDKWLHSLPCCRQPHTKSLCCSLHPNAARKNPLSTYGEEGASSFLLDVHEVIISLMVGARDVSFGFFSFRHARRCARMVSSLFAHGEFVICREVGRKVHRTCCI